MNHTKGSGPIAEQADLIRMRTEQYQMLTDLVRVEVALRKHGERLLEHLSAMVEADARKDAPARRAELQASAEQLRVRHVAISRQLARLVATALEEQGETPT